MIRKVAYFAALAALAAAPALADGGDPPSRVARLNYQSGSVSFRPGSVEEWTAATLNYPLTTGDHLWTEPGALVEMHIDSTAVRMAGGTAFSILNLDDRMAQLSVTQGSIDVRIRDLAPGEAWEIDTPNSAITLLGPGNYRVDADGDRNATTVTVWNGAAEFTGAQGAAPVSVPVGESARISGMDSLTQEIVRAAPFDDFDRWSMARDSREDQSQSVRYVPRRMIGYEDLDGNGVWREYPPYGWVWVPRVAAGWAPYHYGHWAWVEPWGWTWIDDAPWGFAPFHYGRWVQTPFGWAWIPGAMTAPPVYAPALVAFIGGPGFGMSLAFGGGGGVAWFPLGPGEVYRPAYSVSPAYVTQVNMAHVTVTNINATNVRYVNQGVPGAVTAVRRDDFVHAQPVGRAAVAIDAREASRAQVVGSTAQVAPLRESVIARPGGPSAQGPPARFADRQVVARTAPPPLPLSFQTKQQALAANQGRPLDAGTVDNLRRSAPAPSPMVRTIGRAAGPGNNAGQNPPPANVQRPLNDRPQRALDQTSRPAAQAEQPRNDRPVPAAAPANPAPSRQAAPPPKKVEKKPPKKADKT
jgi:hypothetical protein